MHNLKNTPANRAIFIATLVETANVSAACRSIGISRTAVDRWKLRSQEDTTDKYDVHYEDGTVIPFHEAWDSALETACDSLEAEARRRAMGYEEPLTFQGQITYRLDPDTMRLVPVTITKYDNQLMLALLKAHRPDKFRDNLAIEHKGQPTGVLIVPGATSVEDWARMVEEQQAHLRGGGKRVERITD